MSVRKREWGTARGERREAWVVDYLDSQRKRRLKTFARKKEADAFWKRAAGEILDGTHVPDSTSMTVAEAGELWLRKATADGLERATTAGYRQHLEQHIGPKIGQVLLSRLNTPAVRRFEDALAEDGRSPAMVRKVIGSLSMLLGDAQERGLVARNVARDLRGRRRRGKERQVEQRQRRRLEVGVDIPSPAEIRQIISRLEKGRDLHPADPRWWRPLLYTAIFSGLRASELRGLRWDDVDLEAGQIQVRQRADRYNAIGSPKSRSGQRVVPLPPTVVRVLREWKVACPASHLRLVFPNGAGNVESLGNIINRCLIPIQEQARVTIRVGAPGEERMRAKYTGMHALRHFYASWCINPRESDGLGLTAKAVQERLGHASVVITLDTYSHLFPRSDEQAEMARAERALTA